MDGFNPVDHTFSSGPNLKKEEVLERCNTSSKVHSTEMKTIGDKNDCNPQASLPWPARKTVLLVFYPWRHSLVTSKCSEGNRAHSPWNKNYSYGVQEGHLIKSIYNHCCLYIYYGSCWFNQLRTYEKFSLRRRVPLRGRRRYDSQLRLIVLIKCCGYWALSCDPIWPSRWMTRTL